jgi:hypothetical protein
MSLQTRGDVERGFPRVRSKFYDVPRSSGSRQQQQQPPIVAAPFKPVSGGNPVGAQHNTRSQHVFALDHLALCGV